MGWSKKKWIEKKLLKGSIVMKKMLVNKSFLQISSIWV